MTAEEEQTQSQRGGRQALVLCRPHSKVSVGVRGELKAVPDEGFSTQWNARWFLKSQCMLLLADWPLCCGSR